MSELKHEAFKNEYEIRQKKKKKIMSNEAAFRNNYKENNEHFREYFQITLKYLRKYLKWLPNYFKIL